MKLSAQIEAVLALRQQQREADRQTDQAGAGGKDDHASSSDGSSASFKTTREGGTRSSRGSGGATPAIRLYTPSGGFRSPSIPSGHSAPSAHSAASPKRVPPVSADSGTSTRPTPSATSPSPAVAVVPAMSAPTTGAIPPCAAPPSLMERLKAQRAARIATAEDARATEPPLPGTSTNEASYLPAAAAFPHTAPPPSPHPSRLSSPSSLPKRKRRERTSEYHLDSPQKRRDEQNRPAAEGKWGGWEETSLGGAALFPPSAVSLFEPSSLAPEPGASRISPSTSHRLPSGHSPLATGQFYPKHCYSPSNPTPATYPHLDTFSPFVAVPLTTSVPPDRSPSRASDHTILNEAVPLQVPGSAPPPRPSPQRSVVPTSPSLQRRSNESRPQSTSTSSSDRSTERDLWAIRAEREREARQGKLEWERERRERERKVAAAQAETRSPPVKSSGSSQSGKGGSGKESRGGIRDKRSEKEKLRQEEWMRRFNRDVRAYATIEELAPDASADDWGTELNEAKSREQKKRDEKKHTKSRPEPISAQDWPARTPSKQSPPQPISPPDHSPTLKERVRSKPAYLQPEDVQGLQSLLDHLKVQSTSLDARIQERDGGIATAAEHLERMKEAVEARADGTGKKEPGNLNLLGHIDWLVELNTVRQKARRRGVSIDSSIPGAFGPDGELGGGVGVNSGRPVSLQEVNLKKEIQTRIDGLLDASKKAEKKAMSEDRWEKEENQRRESLLSQTGPQTDAAFAPVTHYYHPSAGAFSPAGVYSAQQHAHEQPRHGPRGDAEKAKGIAAQTPITQSRFSPNTSEHVSPQRRHRQRPTQDYGQSGEPLPHPPPQLTPAQPAELFDPTYPDLRLHHDPRKPYHAWSDQEEDMFLPPLTEEQEQLFWEEQALAKYRELHQIWSEVDRKFRKQEKYIAMSTKRQGEVVKRLSELFYRLKLDDTTRAEHLDKILGSVRNLDDGLDKLPETLRLAVAHQTLPTASTDTIPQRESEGSAPRTQMKWVNGDGRMGKRLIPANAVPHGATRTVPGSSTELLGLDGPQVSRPFHDARWNTGAEGARAAQEIDALVDAPALSTVNAGKVTKPEHPIVAEVRANETIQEALKEWGRNDSAGGAKGFGDGDPVAKAFAIYEILVATREIAKKQKEKDKVEELMKKKSQPTGFSFYRLFHKASPQPQPLPTPVQQPLPPQTIDYVSAQVARLLASSEPREKILAGLAALLYDRQPRTAAARAGLVEGDETSRNLGTMLQAWADKNASEEAKLNVELDSLRVRQADLRKQIGERMKEMAEAEE